MELSERRPNHESVFVLPADISQWFDVATLRGWISDEVATLNWQHPDLLECLRNNPNFQPRVWLSLLTLAYATGTFESEELVARCFRDPSLRSLVNGCIPTPAEIGKFRKANRGLLKWALAQVFKRAVREHYGLGEFIPAGIRQALVQDATERLELARHMDRAAQGA